MLVLGPLGFAAPWLLTALLTLPVLWVILRAMPPAPRLIVFPGVALLRGLVDRAPVAHRTPWWLLLLRMLAAAAVILAFSGPVWRPVIQPPSSGNLLVVLDAGWAAAPDWPARQARAEQALSSAAAEGRPAALLLADGRAEPGAIAFRAGDTLLARLRAARPASWPSQLSGNPSAALAQIGDGGLSTLWISDGLDYAGRAEWLSVLSALGPVNVVAPAAPIRALQIEAAEVPVLRMTSTDDATPDVLAIGPDPQGNERALARLRPAASERVGRTVNSPVPIDLPPELRNRITRFQIDGTYHAGAVVLTDDRVRRHKVALVGEADRQAEGQQLLSSLHYLRRALSPVADVIEGGAADVLSAAPDVIILVDQVDLAETSQLTAWVEEGGLLIRFGGPRMAGYENLIDEPLLPVQLRQGGRDIGGALSWGDPRTVRPFENAGVFGGLAVPDEVSIRAQLIAQPSPELGAATIAALSDSTPLVTRSALGQGQLVLFHVTANAEWSNLPLSGLFVQMLDRLISSVGTSIASDAPTDEREQQFWTPQQILDGYGRASPADNLAPVSAEDMAQGPGPERPAGLYVAGERRTALNAGHAFTLADWPGATVESADAPQGHRLMGWLLAVAAVLLAVDALGSAWLARGRRSAAAAILLALALFPAPRVDAQQAELGPDLIRAADEVALAYVVTGDPEIDRISHDGLFGLSMTLRQRSSVEPGMPVGVDLDRDDLSVLTFLYWPITAKQPRPSPQAYLRLNHYLRSGGMILIDTRDGDIAGIGGPDMSTALQDIAAPLDVPPLAPVPLDHVLTRTFYLLDDFPGRWSGRPVWVEAPLADADSEARGQAFRSLNDGVSPVVIGGNAWAEAWAMDEFGMPRFPVGRGWEGERQREDAFRFGVNLIMYVLTGNYKSDQVHVPALLDRLRTESELMP